MSNPIVALIEDDPLLRAPLAYALHGAGFDVVSAANGPEALSMLLEDRRVSVAVVDICLPGRMDGLTVLREARRFNPKLKALITSGAPPDEETGAPFLSKPFRPEQLVEAIRSLLDS